MAQKITLAHFVEKWSKIQLKEKSAAQSHFNDVCALIGHATPTEMDPKGEFFTFEADVDEDTQGGRGPSLARWAAYDAFGGLIALAGRDQRIRSTVMGESEERVR